MADTTAERAVREYLSVLRDPTSMRDTDQVETLRRQLDESDDAIERLMLHQQIEDAQNPPKDRYESDFIEHAREWADRNGITAKAFLAEGVDPAVLRRAGFTVAGRRGAGARRGRRATTGSAATGRSRVSAEEIRAAIPKGDFTVKALQDRTGASLGAVRKVIAEELAGGTLQNKGTDRSHSGPGRAPTLYGR